MIFRICVLTNVRDSLDYILNMTDVYTITTTTITTIITISNSTALRTTTRSTRTGTSKLAYITKYFLINTLICYCCDLDVHAKEAPAIVTAFGRESGDVPPLSDLNIGVVNRLLYLQVRPLQYYYYY